VASPPDASASQRQRRRPFDAVTTAAGGCRRKPPPAPWRRHATVESFIIALAYQKAATPRSGLSGSPPPASRRSGRDMAVRADVDVLRQPPQ